MPAIDKELNSRRPLVSVVMPVRNVAPWVEEAVRSILKQSYRYIELVVVDNASNDNTVERIQKFDDPRIRIIRNQSDIGLCQSLNRGIQKSEGEWIARMDGDDIAHPDRIMRQLEFLKKHNDGVLCATGFGFITPNRKIVHFKHAFGHRKITKNLITTGIAGADASMMFRREIAVAVGLYDIDISMNEKSLWYRLLETGTGYEIDDCLYFARIRNGAMNLGKSDAVRASRAARMRYDPKVTKSKYGKRGIQSPKLLQLHAVRYKIIIFRAAGDVRSIWNSLRETARSQSFKKILSLILFSITGLHSILKMNERKYPLMALQLVNYEAETKHVGNAIKGFGLKLADTDNTTQRLFKIISRMVLSVCK